MDLDGDGCPTLVGGYGGGGPGTGIACCVGGVVADVVAACCGVTVVCVTGATGVVCVCCVVLLYAERWMLLLELAALLVMVWKCLNVLVW